MGNKEFDWKKKRIGYFSASRLGDLMTRGRGKGEDWGKTAIAYLYNIERQRWLREPPREVHAAAMSFGLEQEAYAVEWIRENMETDYEVRHYETGFKEKPFITVDWARYGVSPDADLYDRKTGKIEGLIEIKVVWGAVEISQYFSPSRSYLKKRADAFNEHRDQLAGQLLAFPDVNRIILLKYDGQTDSEFDIRDPLDLSRGVYFVFERSEFGAYLDELKERIILADHYLNLGHEIELINEYYKPKTN